MVYSGAAFAGFYVAVELGVYVVGFCYLLFCCMLFNGVVVLACCGFGFCCSRWVYLLI